MLRGAWALCTPQCTEAIVGLSYGMHVRSRAQRATAALLMICCALFASFELRIADVHDGHSGASADLATWDVAPVTDGPTVTESTGNDRDRSTPAPLPSHAVHVDHCAHAHAGLVPSPALISSELLTMTAVPDRRYQALLNPTVAPPVPPPVG